MGMIPLPLPGGGGEAAEQQAPPEAPGPSIFGSGSEADTNARRGAASDAAADDTPYSSKVG